MVENINSKEAYDLLQKDELAILIDVRTEKEHLTVGIPDLRIFGKEVVTIEWKSSLLPGTRKRFLKDLFCSLVLLPKQNWQLC